MLSACQTAAGAVLSGEGVLSLARAFFSAGADTVIGSRWPIRDEDAAALFDGFYRHVGAGASLSDALRRAKADAIAAHRPARAWASLVLMGDGGSTPFPGGRSGSPSTAQMRAMPIPWWIPLAGAGTLTAIALTWIFTRRARRRPAEP